MAHGRSDHEPTIVESITKYKQGQRRRAKFDIDRKKWCAYTLQPEDSKFESNQAVIACKQFLEYWKAQNYGKMANFLPKVMGSKGGTLPKSVREEYSPFELKSFSLLRAENTAPVLMEITALLDVNGLENEVCMKWIFESAEDSLALPGVDDGEWHINLWGTNWFLSKEQLVSANHYRRPVL